MAWRVASSRPFRRRGGHGSGPLGFLAWSFLPRRPSTGAVHLHSGKVRDLYALADGTAADGRQRPDLGVRLRARHRRSRTRAGCSPRCRCGGSTSSPTWCPNHVRLDRRARAGARAGRSSASGSTMFPVECVARGYLAGSGLATTAATGAVCGVALPAGLVDGCRLPEPIFTPATKAALGDHDENVTYEAVVGRRRCRARRRAARADARGLRPGRGDRPGARHPARRHQARVRRPPRRHDRARRRGADPRLVPLLAGRPLAARAPAAVVRQAVRPRLAHLARQRLGPASGVPPPPLPDRGGGATRGRYVEAYERLTGERF